MLAVSNCSVAGVRFIKEILYSMKGMKALLVAPSFSRRIFGVILFVMFLSQGKAQHGQQESVQYIAIGVSGGLQEGFPDHVKVDYHPGEKDEVQAVFIGRALVRGTKAYLDVMEPGWRQYTHEPGQPLINSVNIVSGCHEHANQYWIYLIDSRQVLAVLNNEPRFLSITPDTAMVDLDAAETDEGVKAFAMYEIEKQQKANNSLVAIPIVVATVYHQSFVPSPSILHHADGTNVTNFPDSLALWAHLDDNDRLVGCSDESQECLAKADIVTAQTRYWDGIRKAIRTAEVNRLEGSSWRANGPPFKCMRLAQMGVGVDHARINRPFSSDELLTIFEAAGYSLDIPQAKLWKNI